MKIREFLIESPLDLLFKKRFEIKMPKGSRGPEVRDIQQALEALGYSVGPPGLDGIIGPYTSGAIKKYQEDSLLNPTGQPSPELVTSLNDTLRGKPNILKKLAPSDSIPSVSVKSGSKHRVDPKEVSSYLTSKGLDRNQILGILVNIEAESNFNSGAFNPNDVDGPSGGLFQHHDSRKGDRRFSNMVNASGGDSWVTNWKGQIDFALSEPAGKQYTRKLFKSPEDATEWWVKHFERPANMDLQTAQRQAKLSKYA